MNFEPLIRINLPSLTKLNAKISYDIKVGWVIFIFQPLLNNSEIISNTLQFIATITLKKKRRKEKNHK